MQPADTEAAAPTDLPSRLRLGTRDLHTAAERTGLMASLLGGHIERTTYCALLRNLHAIYAALEAALAHPRRHPGVAAFDQPAWRREAALAADLAQLHGPDWAADLRVQPGAAAYVQRLQGLGAQGSPALVAHAYVRYLGDLHGGQVLRRRVAEGLGLPAGDGVAFYDFGPPSVVQGLRSQCRAALAALVLAPAEQDLVLAEARWGFEQHIVLFDQLAAGR